MMAEDSGTMMNALQGNSSDWLIEVLNTCGKLVQEVLAAAIDECVENAPDSGLPIASADIPSMIESILDKMILCLAEDITAEMVHSHVRIILVQLQKECNKVLVSLDSIEQKIHGMEEIQGENDDDIAFLQNRAILKSERKLLSRRHESLLLQIDSWIDYRHVVWKVCSADEQFAIEKLQGHIRMVFVRARQFYSRALTFHRTKCLCKQNTLDLLGWNVDQVKEWLQYGVQLPQHVDAFVGAAIDGGMLIELDGTDLVMLGMYSRKEREHLLSCIRLLIFHCERSFEVYASSSSKHQTKIKGNSVMDQHNWLTLTPKMNKMMEKIRVQHESVKMSAGMLLSSFGRRVLDRAGYISHRSQSVCPIQRCFRCHRSRKAYFQMLVLACWSCVRNSVIHDVTTELALTLTTSHREWLLHKAAIAALDIQAYCRRAIIPSIETFKSNWARQDRAASIIQRNVRALTIHKKLMVKAVAFLWLELVLFGRSMERAETYLHKKAAGSVLQSACRRFSIRLALRGNLTYHTLEIVVSWILEESLESCFGMEQIYEGPKRDASEIFLRSRVRAYFIAEAYRTLKSSAIILQSFLRTMQPKSLEFMRTSNSMKMLMDYAIRKRHRQKFLQLCHSVYWLQKKSRQVIVIRSARRYKRIISRLMARAKSLLYRLFFLHVMSLGDAILSSEVKKKYRLPDQSASLHQEALVYPSKTDRRQSISQAEGYLETTKLSRRLDSAMISNAFDVGSLISEFFYRAIEFMESNHSYFASVASIPSLCKNFVDYMLSSDISAPSRHVADVALWLKRNLHALERRWKSCPEPSLLLVPLELFFTHRSGLSWIVHPGIITLELERAAALLALVNSFIQSALTDNTDVGDIAALLLAFQSCCDSVLLQPKEFLSRRNSLDIQEKNPAHCASLISQWLKDRRDKVLSIIDDQPNKNISSITWAKVCMDLSEYCTDKLYVSRFEQVGMDDLQMLSNDVMHCMHSRIENSFVSTSSDHRESWAFDTTHGTAGRRDHIRSPMNDDDNNTHFSSRYSSFANGSDYWENTESPEKGTSASIPFNVVMWSSALLEKLHMILHKWISHNHPLSFLGANTTRRRRDLLQLWTNVAVENAFCRIIFSLFQQMIAENSVEACQMLTVSCLTYSRTEILGKYGILPKLVDIVRSSHTDTQIYKSACNALQTLVSNDSICSKIQIVDACSLASKLDNRPSMCVHEGLLQSLRRILDHHIDYSESFVNIDGFRPKLVSCLKAESGGAFICTLAAQIFDRICHDDEPITSYGKQFEVLTALNLMLQSGQILNIVAALRLLAKMSNVKANCTLIFKFPRLFDSILSIFYIRNSQSFPLTCDILSLLAMEHAVCAVIFQSPHLITILFESMRSQDKDLALGAVKAFRAILHSIECASNIVKESASTEAAVEDAMKCSAQIDQIGGNQHFVNCLFALRQSCEPEICNSATHMLYVVIRLCDAARRIVLQSAENIKIIADGLHNRSVSIKTWSIRMVQSLAVDARSTLILLEAGAFVQLRVLIYTESANEVLSAAISALRIFILGFDRVAKPTDDLVLRIVDFLKSEDEALCAAAIGLVAGMIHQDYITLLLKVISGRHMQQSDRWGFCDPFLKIKINGQTCQTSTQRNTLTPIWNEEFQIYISDKSDDLIMELYDLDHAGEEFLGSTSFSCETLQTLGQFEGQVRTRREGNTQIEALLNESEAKIKKIQTEGEAQSKEIYDSGMNEARRTRDDLLTEAEFLISDPAQTSKEIMQQAQDEADQLMAVANARKKRVEVLKAENQCEIIMKEANHKVRELYAQWEKQTANLRNIPAKAAALKRDASFKYDKIGKEASKAAKEISDSYLREMETVRRETHVKTQEIQDQTNGWYVVLSEDGSPVMGFSGVVKGFDDLGRLVGDLVPRASQIQVEFQYTVDVNVDDLVYQHDWMLERLLHFLVNSESLQVRKDSFRILQGLAEDIEVSRRAIGDLEGIWEVISTALNSQTDVICHFEICYLISYLCKEPSNVMPIMHEPGLLHGLRNLKRYKRTEIAEVLANTLASLDKSSQQIKKIQEQNRAAEKQHRSALEGGPLIISE